jgi:phage FluMu protein gp41
MSAPKKHGWKFINGSTAQCRVAVREATAADLIDLEHAIGRERLRTIPRMPLIKRLREKITDLGGNPL